jgi:hypothetical protein
MSLTAIRAALETTLNAISPALTTIWENTEASTPVNGTAYQRVFLLPGPPLNLEIGPSYTEQGVLQVSLYYPLGTGPAAATARAEAIRAAFKFASTHTASGVKVLVTATPEIGPARTEDDLYFLPVRVRFEAQIYGG